ncbi:kelch-like protein 21 isoform X1 [Clavelina lepadiformis]|uniref:kelch-like protein 21 isoform X1 n=2 Tax=Clavelina lepadiformis TaxID=159417 RepID=UPI004041816E
MASQPKIKQERLDSGYDDQEQISASTQNGRHETSMTSSPSTIDDSVSLSSEKRENTPPRKRLRYDVPTEQKIQNGRGSTLPSLSYQHYDGSHAIGVLSRMNKLRFNENFVDLVLVTDGKEIPCHKAVLCCASHYFSELITANSASRYLQKIHLNDASSQTIMQLVDYAYTSKININDDNIEHILSAATLYKFSNVSKACVMILKQRMTPSNCIAIKKFAVKQSCAELVNFANIFSNENFAEISMSEDFPHLNVKDVICLISSNFLTLDSEEVVFDAVMSWVQHDVTSRKFLLPRLLEHVRLPLVRPQFLLDVVQADPLIKNNKECEKFLNEAQRFQLLPDQRPMMQTKRTQPRQAYVTKKMEVLVTVGGLNKDKQTIANCVYFDLNQPRTTHLAPLSVKQTAYSVAAVKNNIFVTGGACVTPCNEVWMYIPSLDIWQEVAPMIEPRFLHTSVAFNGFLYVLGGSDGTGRLRSVEKYNPDTNSWQDVAPMLKALSSPCAVTCDGMLYVIGGAVGSEPNEIVCDVQSYDPKHNSWKFVTSLPQPERGAVAANLNGTVYLMGQNKAVYSYNRQSNEWVKRCNTLGGHLYGAATVHCGQLCVAGGLHGNSYINGTVETYDYVNDRWFVTSTLHVPVYAQGFVSIVKDDVTSPR